MAAVWADPQVLWEALETTWHGEPVETGYSGHASLWLDLEDWTCLALARANVSGGRGDRLGDPDAAVCSVTLQTRLGSSLPALGQRLDLAAWLPTLPFSTNAVGIFSGLVTDVAAEPDGEGHQLVSIAAADPMGVLAGLRIGDEPWPRETVTQRLQRVWGLIQSKLGSPWWLVWQDPTELEANGSLEVYERDIDSQPALDILRGLYLTAGHTLAFVPDPTGQGEAGPASWAGQFAHIYDLRDSLPETVEVSLPCEHMQLGPRQYVNRRNLVNGMAIGYVANVGGQYEYAEITDQPSVDTHGPRTVRMDTQLVSADDAATFALAWLLRLRQVVPNQDNSVGLATRGVLAKYGVTAVRGWYDSLARAGTAASGAIVQVSDITGTLQYWGLNGTEWNWQDDGWAVALDLSHIMAHVPGTRWVDVDPDTTTWEQVPAGVSWLDYSQT